MTQETTDTRVSLNDEQPPFDWALQDEESFPYFFGAASMTFATAAIRKEDRFA